MATATRRTHDSLILATIAEMRRQGMTSIKASRLPNYTPPSQIGQFIPDTTGFYGANFVVTEAESEEGLSSDHTTDQWRTFYKEASRVGGYFIVVANKADEATARALVRSVCGNASDVLIWLF